MLHPQKKTSTAAVDPHHFKVKVTNFRKCSYVTYRTCYYPMLIAQIKSINNQVNIKHKSVKIKI